MAYFLGSPRTIMKDYSLLSYVGVARITASEADLHNRLNNSRSYFGSYVDAHRSARQSLNCYHMRGGGFAPTILAKRIGNSNAKTFSTKVLRYSIPILLALWAYTFCRNKETIP